MRRLRNGVSIIAAVGLVLVAVSGAWGQSSATAPPPSELTFLGGSARAAAMGGAYIGVADDAAAGFWNPAGLTQNDRVYTGLQFRYQRHRVQNKLDSPVPIEVLYNNISRQNIWDLTFASFNSPLMVKGQRFYLSASWYRAQDDNFESQQSFTGLEGLEINDGGLAGSLTALDVAALSQGGVKVATLAAATQLKEEVLSGGFALNIYIGSGYDSSRTTLDVDREPFNRNLRIHNDVSNRRDYIGVNMGFGLLYQRDQVSVGVAVKTPFQLQTEFDRRVASQLYERTPDSVLFRSESSNLFKFKTKTEMPLQVGVGLAYRPQDNVVLSFDYEYKNFGSSNILVQEDIMDPRSDFVAQDAEWKDVHQIRVGFEYTNEFSFGVVPFRAGFRTEPMPYRNVTNIVVDDPVDGTILQSTLGDQIVGEVYSLGTGIYWNQIHLDLAFEYSSSTRYLDGYYSTHPLRPNFIALQENRRQKISLGFTGYF